MRVAAKSARASQRSRDNLKRFQDFHLNAKARIWPRLPYMCHIRSTSEWERGGRVLVGEDNPVHFSGQSIHPTVGNLQRHRVMPTAFLMEVLTPGRGLERGSGVEGGRLRVDGESVQNGDSGKYLGVFFIFFITLKRRVE